MKICFVFEGYPTNDDPFEPFVREIVFQLSMLGVQCSVIAPQSVMRGLKMHKFRPLKWTEKDEKGNIISANYSKIIGPRGFAGCANFMELVLI